MDNKQTVVRWKQKPFFAQRSIATYGLVFSASSDFLQL